MYFLVTVFARLKKNINYYSMKQPQAGTKVGLDQHKKK